MTDFKSTLTELQQQLRQAQLAALSYSDLYKKREEIEQYELELEIISKNESSKQLPLEKALTENERALKLIKKKKQEVDTILDTIGEDIFEHVNKFREKVLLQVFIHYPEQKIFYQEKLDQLKLVDDDIEKMTSAQALCKDLYEELSKIELTRHHIRRKGIFSYIFGVNPNIAITQHLKSIELLIKESLPLFQNQKEFEELTIFLDALYEKSKARWGFRKIDSTVEVSLVENAKILSHLEILKSQKEIEKQRILASIEQIINFED